MSERSGVVESLIPIWLYREFKEDSYFRLVVGIVFTWGVLDTVSTFIAILAYGTIEYELNPLTAWMLGVHPLMLVVGKAIALGAVSYLAIQGRQSIRKVYGWQVFFHALVWIGVVVALLNIYAAWTAVAGHDPLYEFARTGRDFISIRVQQFTT